MNLAHLILVLLISVLQAVAAEDFLRITAEIEQVGFGPRPDTEDGSWGASAYTQIVTAFVASNSWQIEVCRDNSKGGTNVWAFTGNQLINAYTPVDGSSTQRYTYDSVDGNPMRDIRIADILVDEPGKAIWLAYCSGNFFRDPSHKLYPVHALWKQWFPNSAQMQESAKTFDDALRLPMSVDIHTFEGKPVFQYRAVETTATNSPVHSGRIPQLFYATQYRPSKTRVSEATTIIRGRLLSIEKATAPSELR